MSWNRIYHAVMFRVENVSFEQVTVLVLIIVAVGFFCMRGFGSRTNY